MASRIACLFHRIVTSPTPQLLVSPAAWYTDSMDCCECGTTVNICMWLVILTSRIRNIFLELQMCLLMK
jgi:hypothetical protein